MRNHTLKTTSLPEAQGRCAHSRMINPTQTRAKVDRLCNLTSNSLSFSAWPDLDNRFHGLFWAERGEGSLVLRYRLKVWGPFDLRSLEGRSIRPSVRKSCALLAVLALSDGHRQSRKWLQSLLWSESDDSQGAGSLRQELARLKRLLGSAIQSDRIDIWLDAEQFDFDHLGPMPTPANAELLQGIDIEDEAFEDWLRAQRQFFSNWNVAEAPPAANDAMDPEQATQLQTIGRQPHHGTQRCTVIFDCDAKGSVQANVAAMFFSELLYRKLEQYEVFTCVGHEAATDTLPNVQPAQASAVVRIAAFADGGEVCLGVQVDSGQYGSRLGVQSVLLPHGISRLQDAPEIGRMVQNTVETLLDNVKDESLPTGAATEAMLLANEARKLTFKLDRDSLAKADILLARAYALEPRGEHIGWRGFLRNTAFFQHRTSDIFEDRYASDELSLEALHQAPDNALVQAFSSQLDYVNQGNLVEPMIKAQRAVELDRSDPLARALLSNSLTVNGHLAEGYDVALQSVSLAAGSRYEFYFHHFACMAATAAGDYEAALAHARISVAHVPHFVSPRRYEVALALRLGDRPGVDRAVEAMRRSEPDFDIKSMLDPAYPVNTLRRLPIIEAIQ